MGIIFLMTGLLWGLWDAGPAAAADKIKVSLLLGDLHTKTALTAVKAIYQTHPDLKKKVEFLIYPNLRGENRNRQKNLASISESRLIFILIMGRDLVAAVKPELEQAIKRGGKVYCVQGGSYNDDDKKLGIILDKQVLAYFAAGGPENIKNGLLYSLKQDLGFKVACQEVHKIPEQGIYDYKTRKVFTGFEEYQRAYASRHPGAPWVGVVFYKSHLANGQSQPLHALLKNLEKAGFNVLPVYAPLGTDLGKFFAQDNRQSAAGAGQPGGREPETAAACSRVRLIVALGMKIGIKPQAVIPQFSRLKVPLINAISLYSQSLESWEKSPVGLDIFERSFQVANPEMTGLVQPTVIASRERIVDKDTGLEYIEARPIPERLRRLTARVKAWINLQEKPNKNKKIALIYYNYPPGKNNIGASYLNVLPGSLWEMFLRLDSAGYDVGREGAKIKGRTISKEQLFADIQNYGRNIGNWAQGEIAALVHRGEKAVFPGHPGATPTRGPVLLPLATYRQWFDQLPPAFKNSVLKSWGPVEQSNIMIWRDAGGKKYLVIPAVRYGNLLFTPQPSRGWEQDIKKAYHNVNLAPHHQYVAFYLWLKHGFQADAVVHIGTHGTHEWLSGKEVGFTREDPPEVLIQDMPNIYPYTVDDVGEGLQAKRRGMAVIIDHMTPPLSKAGLNKELKELTALLSDYQAAKEKSSTLAASKLQEINERAKRQGLLTDLKLTEIKTEAQIEEVQDYLDEIAEKQSPFGLHTFGKAPEEKYRKTTAEAILSMEKALTPEERKTRLADLEDRIRRSGPRELDSLTAALAGRYIPAGQGNDPIRNPDSLPTGKNFYAFDPTRLPSTKTYEMGVKMAQDLIAGYQKRHGQLPDKLSFNLWATEAIRHEGVMESQIMYLMGIKPKWDERGRVQGVEAILRAELGRPRLDVTIVPSGLYRDLFANLMALLDQAVSLAKQQTEADNVLRANIMRTRQMLLEKGVALEMAERLATVRLFTTPPGAYGPNIENVIVQSNTWDKDSQVADVFLMRLSHLYGQGFWGEKGEQPAKNGKSAEDLGLTLFKTALSGSKMAVHSRSSNVIASLDNDDFLQELGGLAMTIRVLDGKTPEVYVTNMANPKVPKQETLEKYMGREMRARYLNPEWIKAMMKEGYAGARFVDKVVEHLWGWQVTVPEAVDAAKWNEMYETYVLDKNGLGIKQMFKEAKNTWAYQSLVARMLETVRKGYWQPDQKVIETLSKEYADSAKEVGLACCDHTCNNPLLTEFTSTVLMSVPGLENRVKEFKQALETVKNPSPAAGAAKAQPSPDAKNPSTDSKPKPSQSPPDQSSQKKVEGYEMQEVNKSGFSAAPIPYLFILGFLMFLLLIRWGWRKKGR